MSNFVFDKCCFVTVANGLLISSSLACWFCRTIFALCYVVWLPDCIHTHTHLMALCPGLPRWVSTRKVKPIWILLKQETVSGNGTSWAICKSASHSRQITMPAPHHSLFYRLDALPVAQPTASKHWRLPDCVHTHTHPFNGPFSGTTRVSRYQKGKTNLDFTEAKRQWVAVASAGPYASLHLAPDR